MTTASAAGKAILLGEHAVVYGCPAIAVPVSDVRATAEVTTLPTGRGVLINALDLKRCYLLDREYKDDAARPLQCTVRNTLEHLGIALNGCALRIVVNSQIPIARGMGSGTAVSTAIVRALAQHYARHLSPRTVSDLVYRTEVILHGTPSGIDNAVVAFEEPIYFIKGRRPETFFVGKPFTLVIADTGVVSKTRDTVAQVRHKWVSARGYYNALFDEITAAVEEAKRAIASGDLPQLGAMMNHNQSLLQKLQVSSIELDCLIKAARRAGALGAKLSGGGKGGCMIALGDAETQDKTASALLLAGAAKVFTTTISSSPANTS